jgi:hypothetical protein
MTTPTMRAIVLKCATSSAVSWNMKSAGNRSRLRFTANESSAKVDVSSTSTRRLLRSGSARSAPTEMCANVSIEATSGEIAESRLGSGPASAFAARVNAGPFD